MPSLWISPKKKKKFKQDLGYGEVIVKVGNDETTFANVNDLIKQNKTKKFIIINSMITTTSGDRISLCEGIYLAQQKNPDMGYIVKKSPGRFGADRLNMYPGYSVKYADFNQAMKAYAYENSKVKATQKKHGMNLLTAFFEPSKKKMAKVTQK